MISVRSLHQPQADTASVKIETDDHDVDMLVEFQYF